MPAEELYALFSTYWPSAVAVAKAIGNRTLAGSKRWQGKYVITYDNDAPDAIFFFGYSGD